MKRVLVQHAESKLFIHDERTWTDSLREAREFSCASEALLFCYERGLSGVQLLQLPEAHVLRRTPTEIHSAYAR